MHLLSDSEDGKDNKDIDWLRTINFHSKVLCCIDKFEMCSILSICLSTIFVVCCKSFMMRLHIIAINILLLIGSAM